MILIRYDIYKSNNDFVSCSQKSNNTSLVFGQLPTMNFKIGIILLFPLILAAQLEDPEETGGFFEGDIELTEDQQQELFQPTQSRNGIRSEKYRWPKKTVLYKISSEFGECN